MFLKRKAPSHFAASCIHLAVYLLVHITKKIKQHIEEECMHTLPRLVSSLTLFFVCVTWVDGGGNTTDEC